MRKFSRKSAAALLKASTAGVASLWFANQANWVRAATEVINGVTYYDVNTAGPVLQGTYNGANNNPPITISFSGQTALKNFNISGALTELQPGTSITLNDGTNGAPVLYTAPNDPETNVQLASSNFNNADFWEDPYSGQTYAPGDTSDPQSDILQINSGLVVQWHAEGSVDGFYDLINDEIGYNQTTGPISNESLREPSSANPTYINTNSFTAPGSKSGFTLSSVTDLSDTYSTTEYNQATGQNLLGGQNRVQFSVGEYPTEALATSGTPSPFASAGSPGYGLGNPALTSPTLLTALGTGGARQQFQPSSIANESTSTQDPVTDSNYVAGPWNSAAANNITSVPFAATAVTYSANPGAGLARLDLGDTQWLQTTGRLQNGALFNVVARTVDTGQRVVFALNTGIDPSWAVGSNDDGNSTTTAAATAQHSIGPSLRFDGKTSGSEAEATIAQSRMSVGALSLPEATAAVSNAPVRVLNIDFTDQTNINSATDSSSFISPNFNSIISDGVDPITSISGDPASGTVVPRYPAVLISHYNTVKAPNQTALDNGLIAAGLNPATATAAQQLAVWNSLSSFNPSNLSDPTATGIQGDPTGDVAAVLANVINSDNTATKFGSPASAVDPADGLLSTGYLIPGLLDWTRQTDGGAITLAPVQANSNAATEQGYAYDNYSSLFTSAGTSAANNQTVGSDAYYAAGGSNGVAINEPTNTYNNQSFAAGQIPITAKDVTWTNGVVTSVSPAANGDTNAEGGNYLFGNFNQTGVRDYSAVQESVYAALALAAVDVTAGGKDSIFTPDGGLADNVVILPVVGDPAVDPGWSQTGTNTKGDLIVLGDYNGDGKFDGQDLYDFAIGASLADNTSSGTLTATVSTFSDAVRNPNAVLRKNAALDYVGSTLNSYLDSSNPTYQTAAAFLLKTGAAVLSGSSVPAGATDLHTKDPITGLEQFTYDPTGANAFNPQDVNRDGVVDINDAILVDEYYGQSYQNLTQSLAATAQTPVSGAIEPISLVAVQQVDGEAAIGAADLAQINSGLSGVGNANWYGYNVQKTGPGTIDWGRTGGTVTVYSGASLEVSSGVLQVGGSLDPFSDNNAAGTSTAGNHVAVTVNGGAKLQYTEPGLTSTVSSLTINTGSGASVDVGPSTLAIDFTPGNDPASTIRGYLQSGYANDKWNGAGIYSTNAQANPGLYAVGYVDGNTDVGTPAAANQILIRNTVAGDANFDGIVNFSDLLVVAQDYGRTGQDWAHGDFNYDGLVNFSDLLLVAQNYGRQLSAGQLSQLPGSFAAEWQLAQTEVSAAQSSSVPEPATTSLLAVTAGGLLARRRRTRRII